MLQHIILRLDAPMISCGGETIDNIGVVRDFPALSMLTGLLANALGWDRTESDRLDRLQDRISFAAARLQPGTRHQEYQTARLFEKDAGWTTRNRPEGRAPSPSFSWDAGWETARGAKVKSLTHQRYRDFDAEAVLIVALSLEPVAEAPELDQVATALMRPERPLFIGRKPFVPSGPILTNRNIQAACPLDALSMALEPEKEKRIQVQWPARATDLPGQKHATAGSRTLMIERLSRVSDIRRHVAGVHGGTREIATGVLYSTEGEPTS